MTWEHPTTEFGATAQVQAECDCPHPKKCKLNGCRHAPYDTVVFLDVDGVLNKAPDYAVRIEGQRSCFLVNQRLVDRFIKVLEETGARVVLSSSWRVMRGGREFIEHVGIPIQDVTDNKGKKRGEEIQRWLDAHPEVVRYAIVDDDGDMLDHQLPHFVLTEFETGLTKQAAYRLTYKLGGEIPLGVSR